jgi:predicted dehydrogenase
MIKVALIGVGGMGKRWARALSGFDGISLTAIVDRDVKMAEEVSSQHGGGAFGTFEDLIAGEKPDACVIAVPHAHLASLSRKALAAGMHVLVEKPGARTVREMDEMVALAREKERTLMVGYNYRYFPGPQKARELVDSGRIGDITFIRARHGFGGRKGYEKNWRHEKATSGGGQLIDQGVHLIDLARWFLGDIKESCGMLSNVFWKTGARPVRDAERLVPGGDTVIAESEEQEFSQRTEISNGVEDNAFALLKNKKGTVASIHASWTQWDPMFSFEVYGTKGSVIVDGLGKKYGNGERVVVGRRTDDFTFSEEEVIECDSNADKALVRELEEFVRAIQERRDPRPSGSDGLEVLKIVEKIYQSFI